MVEKFTSDINSTSVQSAIRSENISELGVLHTLPSRFVGEQEVSQSREPVFQFCPIGLTAVALRVAIHKQHSPPQQFQPVSQVGRRCRLTDTSFLVTYRYDFHSQSPSYKYEYKYEYTCSLLPLLRFCQARITQFLLFFLVSITSLYLR